MTTLLTIVELPEFQKRARSIMSGEEREQIVLFLAANPEAGLSLGGGLRKVRVPRSGGGKSGGFRVVYVFWRNAHAFVSGDCLRQERKK